MNQLIFAMYMKFKELTSTERGQNLVEYTFVAALLALGTTASMRTLSGAIGTALGAVSTDIANSL